MIKCKNKNNNCINNNRNFNYKNQNAGVTLIEIIVALAIISIIMIPVFGLLNHSFMMVIDSRRTMEASNIAQQIVEERYMESRDLTVQPPLQGINKDWLSNSDFDYLMNQKDFWIVEEIEREGRIIKLLIRIYNDNNETKLLAQIESRFIWLFEEGGS
ncbi:prepilin-type N-terminal cleavage/methylation domain-containing protein [Natranaerovirga pectinivora]|uniref:Prepilin-type N-terminal cleavage/methylation domain-containing protein n=1 Tax=Natranaerovirga pectinivora TaxID=682400 RepID=A0A4R3MPW9_9FIRM|nr:prepilin-type N-terminal cleavage/methylation domain-containing protein [Natranaerovirga pectinivora]TCT16902.1 prepilin-type N-terminal cleavage/methylation domain-containing protein [Natranaerovirga pectinivora]